jgi:hypothetical protein
MAYHYKPLQCQVNHISQNRKQYWIKLNIKKLEETWQSLWFHGVSRYKRSFYIFGHSPQFDVWSNKALISKGEQFGAPEIKLMIEKTILDEIAYRTYTTAYRDPIIGYGSANNPEFATLSQWINDQHLLRIKLNSVRSIFAPGSESLSLEFLLMVNY